MVLALKSQAIVCECKHHLYYEFDLVYILCTVLQSNFLNHKELSDAACQLPKSCLQLLLMFAICIPFFWIKQEQLPMA